MAYQHSINVLQGGDVLAECGPMRLVISSFVGKVPQREMNVLAAEKSFQFLERLSGSRRILSRPHRFLPQDVKEPLALEMIKSAMAIGDPDLTPMSAVAGTIADAVADFLSDRGMTKVIVNNGGDVAVRLQGEESVKVGIRKDVRNDGFAHVLVLPPSRSSWGVATSGLGGRSFTRGIASATTVVSRTASSADAAATAVANACYAESPLVIQKAAELIDPETDIPGIPVTLEVGSLDEEDKLAALESALNMASGLIERGVVSGAFVAVGEHIGMTGFFQEHLIQWNH